MYSQFNSTQLAFISLIRAFKTRSRVYARYQTTFQVQDARIAIVFFCSSVDEMIHYISHKFIFKYAERKEINGVILPNLNDQNLLFLGRKKNSTQDKLFPVDIIERLEKLPNMFRKIAGIQHKEVKEECPKYRKLLEKFKDYQILRNYIVHGSYDANDEKITKRKLELFCWVEKEEKQWEDLNLIINKSYEVSKNCIDLLKHFCKVSMPQHAEKIINDNFNYLDILYHGIFTHERISKKLRSNLIEDFGIEEVSKYPK